MSLSERLRPGVEAAPWVIDEVKQLEAELDRLRGLLTQAAGDMSRGPESPRTLFATAVAAGKWFSLQQDGYRMERIHFARSVDGHEQRGTIDPWGRCCWIGRD